MSEHNITADTKGFVTQELQIRDDSSITLGTTSDVTIKYDETNNDALEFSANVEGKALNIILKADQGDNKGDSWKLSVADGGNLTLGNDIDEQNTFETHLTIVPNATPADSTTTVAGNLTIGGDLTVTGSSAGVVPSNVVVADESADTTCFPVFVTQASGNLPLKTGSNISFNSNTGLLTSTSLQTTTIDLGHASDTTIARDSAVLYQLKELKSELEQLL